MIGKSGQPGLSAVDQSILGQAPRTPEPKRGQPALSSSIETLLYPLYSVTTGLILTGASGQKPLDRAPEKKNISE
jgi:hypothetical protein